MPPRRRASVAEEINQTRPFTSIEQETYLAILLTASRLSRSADRFFKNYGITQAQYNVLRILRGAGPAGLCRHAIAARLVTAVPDVTRLLDRMETSGWIARQRNPTDRREVSATITPAGAALLAELDQPLRHHGLALFQDIPKPRLETLLDLLAEVRASIA